MARKIAVLNRLIAAGYDPNKALFAMAQAYALSPEDIAALAAVVRAALQARAA